MTKETENKVNYSKAHLEKSLRTRLGILTTSLHSADITGKGIDLIKEIKELYSMIAALKPESKTQKTENSKIEVVWAEQNNSNNNNDTKNKVDTKS